MEFTETWLTSEQESLFILEGYRHFFVSQIHVKGSSFSIEALESRKFNPNIE